MNAGPRLARASAMLLLGLAALVTVLLPGRAQASMPTLASTPTPETADAAKALQAQGEALYEQEEYEQALTLFQQAAAIYRTLADREGEAGSLKKVGWCYTALRMHDEAYGVFQQELAIRQALGDLAGEGAVYLNIGLSFSRVDQYEQAVEFTRRAIPVLEEAGDREGVLIAYDNLDGYLREQEDFLGAVEAGQAGLALAQALGDAGRAGRLWRGLGISFRNLERYEESIEAYDRALEIWRDLGDPAQEARDLGNQAIAYRAHGEPVLAAEAYAAAAVIEGELGLSEDQAQDQLWAGALYMEAFEYDRAIELIKVWLGSDLAEADPSLTASAWNDLGICYMSIGEYRQAEEAILASLELKQTNGDRDGAAMGWGNLGAISHALGEYDAALEYFNEALQLDREAGDTRYEAQTLDNIGRTYHDMGALDQAWSYYQQSLDLRREIGDREGEADALNGLGDLQLGLGDTDQALALIQQSLETSRSIGYPEGEIAALERMGRIQSDRGDFEAAVTSYTAGLEVSERIGLQVATARILDGLGYSYYRLGDATQAERCYERALGIARGLKDRALQAAILHDRAALKKTPGSFDEALQFYLEALQLAREDNYRVGEADDLYSIGLLYEDQGEDESALQYYLASLEIREAVRESIRLEAYRSAVASGDMFVYQRATALLLKLERYDEAFDLTERSRSRSFLDQMGSGAVSLREGVDAELLERESLLLQEITALENDLLGESPVITGERTGSTAEAFQARLAAKRQEYVDLLAEIKLANPELATLVSVSTMDLASIQAALAPDTTLVSYYVLEDSVAAFVVSHEALNVVQLPGTAESYRQAAEDFRTLGIANLANPHPVSLVELYQGLITPLLPYLNTTRLGITAHQWMHYIPFAALSDGERYLGERFTVYDLPSVSMLQFLEAGAGEAGASPVVFGNPTTDNPELASLEFAADEAERVAELLGVEAVIGPEASEATLQSRAGNANVIHLAAHGTFDPQAPLFSRIWLAPSEEADGRLNVHEVYGLDLSRTELVVLSACQTNLGELSAGDDIVGLNRAFLYSAPAVISSLWSVDDEATGVLMDAFYARLLGGMGKAEALQAAQAAVRTNAYHPEWVHPYYWAAFVVSGDPGPVSGDLGSATGGAGLGSGAAPALLALAGAALTGAAGYLVLRTVKRRRGSNVIENANGRDGSNGH